MRGDKKGGAMSAENDLVLIYFEDNPLVFARIEAILPDSKPEWYHVKLLMLQVPPQVVTWILRDVYINGHEFTMNGKRMRLEKVEPDESEGHHQSGEPTSGAQENSAKVISLADLKKP